MRKITTFSAIMMVFALMSTSLFAGSKKMVLIEEATNASCPPCASQNPDFQEFLMNNLDNVVPLIYHASWPGDDVMHAENPGQNNTRVSYYNVSGVPSARVNGQIAPPAGQFYEGAPGDTTALANEMAKYTGDSPLTIDINHTINGSVGNVEVTVNSDQDYSNKIIHIAAVESFHYYENAGTNGEKEFYFIMREMLPGATGQSFSITSGGTETFNETYTIENEWNTGNMMIVAFIQDNGNKKVLQAAKSARPDVYEINTALNSPFLLGTEGSATTGTFTIENPMNQEVSVEISESANAAYPNDWSYTLPQTTYTIPAGGMVDVNVDINAGSTITYSAFNFDVAISGDFPQGSILKSGSASFGVLHENTKNIHFIGYNDFVMAYLNSLMNNQTYGSKAAYVPLSPDAMNAYPADMFDFVGINNDYNHRGYLGHQQLESLIQAVYGYAGDVLDNGGNVMMNAPLALTFAFGDAGSSTAKSFFENTLGIEHANTIGLSEVANNQISLFEFSLEGINGDEITDGMSFNCNRYNAQSNPYYQRYADEISIQSGSSAEPIMNINIQNNTLLAGVKAEIGNGKMVYTTFGLNAFSSQDDRNEFFDAVVQWFEGAPAPGDPEISTDISTVNFGDSEGETLTDEVEISNTGDEDLSITSIVINNDADNVFAVQNTGEITIAPGGDPETITVEFTPTEAKEYTAQLVINSNAANDSEYEVSLIGNGTVSVRDGIAGLNSRFTVSAGPNPFVDQTSLTYNVAGQTGSNVEIDLIDAAGNIVRNDIVNEFAAPGEYKVDLNSAGLSSGTYYVIAKGNGVNAQLPVVIQK